MTKQEYIAELEFILETEAGELNEDTRLLDLSGWDSTSHLGMIALLDRLGIRGDIEKIRNSQTVADLIRLAGDSVE